MDRPGLGRHGSVSRPNNDLLWTQEILSGPWPFPVYKIPKQNQRRHRNVLKQYGLIDFFSKGKGDPNILYTILELRKQPEVVKKANNITTPVTTPVTTHDAYKQSKSKEEELFVEVLGEVKKYSLMSLPIFF